MIQIQNKYWLQKLGPKVEQLIYLSYKYNEIVPYCAGTTPLSYLCNTR